MSSAARPLVIATAFAASLVLGLLIVFWAMGGVSKVAQPAAIGGPFQLTDQNGKAVTDKNLKGKPTLIFFGYTHCPDVCPTSLFEISEVLRAMGKDADKVNAVFISVDPERDTPAAMKDYLSSFDPAPRRPQRRSRRRSPTSSSPTGSMPRRSRPRTATTPWTTPR